MVHRAHSNFSRVTRLSPERMRTTPCMFSRHKPLFSASRLLANDYVTVPPYAGVMNSGFIEESAEVSSMSGSPADREMPASMVVGFPKISRKTLNAAIQRRFTDRHAVCRTS